MVENAWVNPPNMNKTKGDGNVVSKIVVAKESESEEKEVEQVEGKMEHVETEGKDRRNVVIVDTGAIINCVKLEKFGLDALIVTTPGVFAEIKSSRSRSILSSIPFRLKIQEPSKEAMQVVKTYAEKTGDYGALSLTDLEILALSYDYELKENGTKNIKPEPKDLNLKKLTKTKLTPYSELSNEEKEVENSWGDFDEDDDDGWVTKDNIKDMRMRSLEEKYNWSSAVEDPSGGEEEVSHVGCITTDFAMQNVLLSMGLNLISLNGMKIRSIRRWVIRCIACGAIDPDTTKEFCPSCGNYSTMKRVECIIGKDGVPKFYYNPNYKISLKGTNYRVPLPKGGKKNNDAVLREDMQSRFKTLNGAPRKSSRILKQVKSGGTAIDPFDLDFNFESGFSTASRKGENQWTKKNRFISGNPNAQKRKYKKSRKGKR